MDAVEPRALADLVRTGINDLIVLKQWKKIARREKKMKNELVGFANEYEGRD